MHLSAVICVHFATLCPHCTTLLTTNGHQDYYRSMKRRRDINWWFPIRIPRGSSVLCVEFTCCPCVHLNAGHMHTQPEV